MSTTLTGTMDPAWLRNMDYMQKRNEISRVYGSAIMAAKIEYKSARKLSINDKRTKSYAKRAYTEQRQKALKIRDEAIALERALFVLQGGVLGKGDK